MIKVNKNVGETPLELINRLREEAPELKDERLSYAGRLDPMAEGQMLILVGDENDNREKYLGLDKEYEAEFLVGVSTDSGDILGKILNTQLDNKIETKNLESQIKNLKNIKEQKYPWFSGKTVNGKKLFEYFKEGKIDIERPSLNVEIKEINFIELTQINKEEIKKYILESIGKVKGDFRQEDILKDWHKFLQSAPEEFQTFKIKLTVSSGTFIRALSEEFNFSCCLLRLKRTKIFL